ncbi:hypothetical protein ASD11_03225 [Aeromicrobium sp. Root495]|uniref:DsbA family protein n=1 Tax=Aeromicrobium sp. Root495 TaxID=1736550 RepID=UPI0006FA7AAE|nr:thioredoxin domain-containing protein [Aeromicrobium sp. Root495]KQY58678.1 hypothetical protein ASD11_03225 [Aeromicrobium sp. Root495]
MSNDRQQRAARAEQMRKEREKADKKQRNLITVAIVVIVVALVAAGGWAIAKTSSENAVAEDVVPPASSTKDFGITYTPEDAGASAAVVKKSADPVTVVLYEDFQCPVCKQFEAAFGAALDGLVKNGDIQIEYRLLNFLDNNGGSPNGYSGRAGSAALCVYDAQGGAAYKKVHDALYAAQPEEGTNGPEAPELIDTVKTAGITTNAALESCIKKEKYQPWIEEGVKDSREKKVSGTPTVMVDGKTVEGQGGGVPTFDQIQAAVTAAKKA